MAYVHVNAGICGFCSDIKVCSEDMQTAVITMKTECPNLKPLEQELNVVDGYVECFAKIGTSGIYETVRKYCKHPACPVAAAIIKGVEVACGLALPKNVEMQISKEDSI